MRKERELKMKKLIDKCILCKGCGESGKWAEPEKIFYTVELEKWTGGVCNYNLFSKPTIKLRPKYRDDEGIKNHELAHARQYGRLLWLHPLLLSFGWYRLFTELQAYREQVKAYNYTTKSEYDWIVNSLYSKYNIDMDKKKIQEYADYTFKDLL